MVFSNDVRIVRVPVALHIGKGVIMPGYTALAKHYIQHSDVCFLNLPCTPIEAISLPVLAHKARKPIVGIYHCDLKLPPGPANRFTNAVVKASVNYAAKTVDKLVIACRNYLSMLDRY